MASDGDLILPLGDDWHQHLRQDDLSRAVVPLIRPAGIQRCIVMPNTIPACTTPDMCYDYHENLLKAGAGGEELGQGNTALDLKMLLYLSPDLTPELLEQACNDPKFKKKDGSRLITGVKSYPKGVTTNSDAGVESYEVYYPAFEAMQNKEFPGQSVMLAEACFLTDFEKLAKDFPKLKIVLEHVSTKEAVDMVCELGENVAASVTAHHLDICIDQVVGCCHHFCKPVPKLPRDRDAIREVVFAGNPKFFFGSDSAPHSRSKKEGPNPAAAGVFTGANLISYLADIFGQARKLDKLADFIGKFGAEFLGHPILTEPKMRIYRDVHEVPLSYGEEVLGKDHAVVPFRAGQLLDYRVELL